MADQDALASSILRLLRNSGNRTFRAKEIARQLDIRDNKRFKRFMETLHALADDGKIVRKGTQFSYRSAPEEATGRLTVHPQGYGFVLVEGRATDLFVPPDAMKNALDGDTVEVKIQSPPGDQRPEAAVVRVVSRGRSQVVGTFKLRGKSGVVKPDEPRFRYDVFVGPEGIGAAKDGDKVIVSLDQFEKGEIMPSGRILQVLGHSDDPEVRVLALALALDVRSDFPEEALAESEALPDTIADEEIKRRLDLRQSRIFTIDPVDAKDFDDAIHVTPLENGDVEVGVHIADVSHYVRPGTALDAEAYARGTSVYLVDRVIPMLPEKLSNRVCSLAPHEDSLTYSCIMRVGPDGTLRSWKIAETVIHSHARFSYEEAQTILEGQAEHEYAGDLRRAAALAATLTKKRMAEGSIDFDLPEVRIVLHEEGHATGVYRKERMASHRLIEEFMLLANRAVALESQKRPMMYRIHEPPDAERIQALAEYVRAFGLKLPLTEGNVTSHDLNRLLNEVQGTPESIVVTSAALRSMSKAKYSPHNAGHYGLGFSHYTHFTSPIRRYPDLIVHRLTKQYLAGGPDAEMEKLESQGLHLSEREKAATEAERESVKLKQIEYLQGHVGDVFEGVVSGVAKFGIFVEISDVLVEGLLHVRDLRDDRYEYDERRYTLVGKHHGRRFRPGDTLRVSVAAANPETRTVDLLLAEG